MNINAMNTKLYYAAPETRRVELRPEAGILTFSDDGKGGASGTPMEQDDSTFGNGW